MEVAAGTCACGRALAPLAGNVVCLDMTPAMLSVGKAEAEKNMTFVRGDAMELLFWTIALISFSPVLHFTNFPIQSNVCRVLKPNGKLVLIDLEAAEESLRNTEDEIDRLRVPSHMRNLSRAEMLALYQTHDLPVECCEAVKPAVLQNGWIIPKSRRRYRWILRGRWSGRLRVEKKQALPFITETERFSSTTDGP